MKKRKTANFILGMLLEVTTRCNNNCRHCYNNISPNARSAIEKEITFEEIKRIADEAVKMGCLSCILTGGEPLLREDFSEIYIHLKRKGLQLSINTNATLITEDHIDLFKKYPPRIIEVSIYGITRKTYERVSRKKGSFDNFIKGLDLLINNDIKIRLKTVAIKSNFHELPDIARFCHDITGTTLFFSPFIHMRHDGDSLKNEDIKSERLFPEEIIAMENFDPEILGIHEIVCNRFDQSLDSRELILPCANADFCNFSVSSNCHLRACLALNHPDCIYDLRKGSLQDAWNNFIPKIKKLRSTKGAGRDCLDCKIIRFCHSCPSYAYMENGDLESKVSYYCEIAHARAKTFGIDTL